MTLRGIILNSGTIIVPVEGRRITEPGIFNQQRIGRQRQQVEKPVGVALRHRGIHQQRAGQTVGMREPPFLAHEQLPGAALRRRVRLTATVDHRTGGERFAVG